MGFILWLSRHLRGQGEFLSSCRVVKAETGDILIARQVIIERGFKNGGWLFGDSDVKQGIEYIKANWPEDAIAQWEGLVVQDPMNSAA